MFRGMGKHRSCRVFRGRRVSLAEARITGYRPCFRRVVDISFVSSAKIMDVSQEDGTDVVKVGVVKRGRTRRAASSRRACRIMLTIEYDALCLVCCEFAPNVFHILRQLCPLGKCHAATAGWVSGIDSS
jgi:hypothetical protein